MHIQLNCLKVLVSQGHLLDMEKKPKKLKRFNVFICYPIVDTQNVQKQKISVPIIDEELK